MALKQMEELANQALGQFKVRDVALVHRLGRLEIGETSVLIAVASAHRGVAFDACRWLIDTLKRTVPIWKKEHFVDGAVWADGEPFPAEIPRVQGSPSGQPAKISVFDKESALPLSIILEVDTSLSTKKDLPLELASARHFAHTILRPRICVAALDHSGCRHQPEHKERSSA